MSQKKWFPTTHFEVKRWFRDFVFDLRLKSASGRKRIWDGLGKVSEQHSLIALLESTLSLGGDVMECGVYRGGSLLRIGRALKEKSPEKRLYGLDSFEGFPQDKIDERDMGPGRKLNHVKKKFRYCADTPNRLQRFFDAFEINGEAVPGFFSDTLPRFHDHKFCFVHLDVDIYQSYMECLEVVYDRLVPGGVIVFDEACTEVWPGGKMAIDEFFGNRPEELERCTDRKKDSFFIRKTAQSAQKAA
jgi:hypothetical protein